MAEFTTPPNTTGLGTGEYLVPSQDPICGIALLDESDPEYPDLSIVRLRVGSDMRRMEAALLRLNKEWIQQSAQRKGGR